MQIILTTSTDPFVDGGATFLVDWLESALLEAGHSVETLRFPFDPSPDALLAQILALRMLDLTQHGDRLIAVRPPSYLIRHPNKFVWFIHHHRGLYDLWGTRYQSIPSTPDGMRLRDAVVQADTKALLEARRVFCNSKVVSDRLKRFNGIDAEVLYPPLHKPERFRCDDYGNYVLYVSRLTHHKRQWLALQAMRLTQTPVRLVIAGRPDPQQESYAQQLRHQVQSWGLTDRVQIVDQWISEEEKMALFAGCLASAYFPFDEDSYGYPSLEAHHSEKCVLTTLDSGGTLELIQDGLNGFVVAPTPSALAVAMDRLYSDRDNTARMGRAGRRHVEQLQIGWPRVLHRLLQ